jgi:hypothetical protein
MNNSSPFRVAAVLTTLFMSPALAQEATPEDTPSDQLRDGLQQFSEGTQRLMESLMEDMRPIIEQELLPLLEDLGDRIGDLSLYYPPEILPNGDIIIRRRDPINEPPNGEIEL